MAENVLIVQNRNAHAIDWPQALAGASQRVFLVCDRLTEQRLAERGWTPLFQEVHAAFPGTPAEVKAFAGRMIHRLGGAGQVIVCSNHEDDVELCASLREQYGLPGPQPGDVARFRDKLVMKHRLAAHPEWLPRYLRFEPHAYAAGPAAYARHAVERLGLPIFAKPINAAGSQGTCLLETEAALHAWAQGLTGDTVYELDEFLSAPLYHCDFLVAGGRILDRHVSRYLYPNGDFLQGKPLGSVTLAETEEAYRSLSGFSLQVLEAFQPLPDGALHLEVFRFPNGDCRFLEIACRAPGAHIPALYKAQCGIDYRSAPYELVLKGAPHQTPPLGRYCATAWFPFLPGTVVGVREYRSSGSQFSMNVLRGAGALPRAGSLADRMAELLLWSDDAQQLQADFEALREFHPAILAGPAPGAGGQAPAAPEGHGPPR
ncbi:ATP-grasp domain-containing protein [Stigmatella erecta]|uniref:Biotin carboxylase n=1 Tax=Stigmatella erecta TaxID=83460 RepID=A0A1I0L7W0_9BACT|nr:hypothetical protein [Stigmatella erecta]SEU35749.1 Biotin carboxylase [Stigmatella erecta]